MLPTAEMETVVLADLAVVAAVGSVVVGTATQRAGVVAQLAGVVDMSFVVDGGSGVGAGRGRTMVGAVTVDVTVIDWFVLRTLVRCWAQIRQTEA